MLTYLAVLFLTSFFSLLAQYKLSYAEGAGLKPRYSLFTKFNLFIAAAVLVLVAGLRYRVGTDYAAYASNYYDYIIEVWQSIKSLDEPVIRIIAWIGSKFYNDYASMLFLAAVVTIALSMRTIYKNTDKFLFATLLYIFLGCWTGLFNGVRQYLACAIVFAGHRFIFEKKFLKYALVVFLAFLTHKSALIMIVFYFVANRKITVMNMVILALGTVVLLYSYDYVFEIIGWAREAPLPRDTYITSSVNPLRIAVAIAPALLIPVYLKEIEINPEKTFYANWLIIHGAMMVATSRSAYLARMGIYTGIFTAIALPRILDKKSRQNFILETAIIVFYFAYWWYEIMTSSYLIPFRWIWER